MSNRKLRVARVSMRKDRRGATYWCYDRRSDVCTLGRLSFGRVISGDEAKVLRRRLEGLRYDQIDDVLFKVLGVHVGIHVSLGNKTSRLNG